MIAAKLINFEILAGWVLRLRLNATQPNTKHSESYARRIDCMYIISA